MHFKFLDCLSRETQIKVSAVLNNMVTVGSVNCVEEEALCQFLGRRSGVVFYPAREVTPEHSTVRYEHCTLQLFAFLLFLYILFCQPMSTLFVNKIIDFNVLVVFI